jgi:hypothetical protein
VIEDYPVGNMAIAEMTQTVKVVIDGNRLVMEHAQENWQKKLDVEIGFHSAEEAR